MDFEINLFDQIQMLVYKITEHEGIPEDQQRLIFAGTQLELDRNAAMYGIQNGSTIHLVLKLVRIESCLCFAHRRRISVIISRALTNSDCSSLPYSVVCCETMHSAELESR